MKKDPLNNRLIEEFPVLSTTYDKVKGGAFDLDTPASNFYEGVFVPYLLECMDKKDEKEISHCFSFIEEMMNDEEDAQEVVQSFVLCSLSDRGIRIPEDKLGPKSLEYYLNWIKE